MGDILRLVENDEIPCDVVLLSCSDPLGNCFIQVRWRGWGLECVVACATGSRPSLACTPCVILASIPSLSFIFSLVQLCTLGTRSVGVV